MAAAEQLAEEMGLDEAAHRQLEQRLLANHYAKQQQQQMYMQPPPQQQMYMQQQMPDQYVPRAKSVGFHQPTALDQEEPAAAFAPAAQDNFRSSSRVLAPPGGGSSICFG